SAVRKQRGTASSSRRTSPAGRTRRWCRPRTGPSAPPCATTSFRSSPSQAVTRRSDWRPPVGTRGPVPKREDERRRRNKNEDGIETTTVKVDEGPVKAPDVDTEWHPIAQEWFSSLRESAQSRFYEPSDWATAKYIA